MRMDATRGAAAFAMVARQLATRLVSDYVSFTYLAVVVVT